MELLKVPTESDFELNIEVMYVTNKIEHREIDFLKKQEADRVDVFKLY